MGESSTIARLVQYRGTVQGVGFRYTAMSIARHYPIAGWVCNLADGSVEMLLEGPAAEVEACLQEIRSYWGAMITSESIEPCEPARLSGFEIRR
jgi:acylphosphatase